MNMECVSVISITLLCYYNSMSYRVKQLLVNNSIASNLVKMYCYVYISIYYILQNLMVKFYEVYNNLEIVSSLVRKNVNYNLFSVFKVTLMTTIYCIYLLVYHNRILQLHNF